MSTPFDKQSKRVSVMSMHTQHNLHDLLRSFVVADGRSVYRLSKDSGISQAVLSRFMRDERDLNLRTADRL